MVELEIGEDLQKKTDEVQTRIDQIRPNLPREIDEPLVQRVEFDSLPISTFAETSGTYVNLEGLWQSFAGAAKPLGEARPGWKVLRVLGNLAGVADFDYQSSEEVREELRALCGSIAASSYQGTHEAKVSASDARVIDVPMYAVDAVLRRAPSLQRTREGKGAAVAYGGGQGA